VDEFSEEGYSGDKQDKETTQTEETDSKHLLDLLTTGYHPAPSSDERQETIFAKADTLSGLHFYL